MMFSPRSPDEIFIDFFGGSSLMQTPAVEMPLACSLEDLYMGTTKKVKISWKTVDASGKPKTVEEDLTIDIKPGWKKGTKIIFPRKGKMQPNLISSDLIFIIDESPHGVFKREGNDLVVTQKINLIEAVTGHTVQLTTLDGRNLTIPICTVKGHEDEEVVQGEGMPIPEEAPKKGNLRIRFQVQFPCEITPEQKNDIKREFGHMCMIM